MTTKIKATTNINVQSGRNKPTSLFSQAYDYIEEAASNIQRVIQPDTVETISVVPDTDIQSSIKIVHISADGSVSDLTATRVAMLVRKYQVPKSSTPSNEFITDFDDDVVVYGALSGERVAGTKNLAKPLSLKGGAIGAMLSRDSDGNEINYPDNNALPLVLKVDNKGTSAITVKVKSLYDPTPATHRGTL